MDLLGLWAKIALDDTEFQDGMDKAAKSSKTVKSAVESLQSPLDKVEKAINAVSHPAETVKSAFDGLIQKTEAIIHPIDTLKKKWEESSSSLERQRNMLGSLANRYESAKQTVSDLTKAYDESVKKSGKYSEESRKLADQLASAQGSALAAKDAMEKYAATLAKGREESSKTASGISDLSDKMKDNLVGAAKIGGAAIGAASAAVGVLVKSSIEGYAEYEQLVGGVETLFKASSDVVMEYANNAYKTAGLSANQYMETVTGFSASLLQSLGGDTERAAQVADLAITDMADNANKMGTAMDSIQYAYQGFAKQNYTMLDNLKLGYGGTKEEMERLLSDAEKLSGQKFDLSSYADIVEAIHVVQTEMGITGTTALEAATTIQGSVSAAKSAWKNLVAGLGDENANLDQLVGNLVSSVETAAGNIIPRVTQILSGMGTAITDNLPAVATAGGALLAMFQTGIIDKIPEMIENLPQVIDAILNFVTENLHAVLDKGSELLSNFAFGILEYIPQLVEQLPEIIRSITKFFTDNFPVILKKGGELLGQLIMGILGTIPEIAVRLPEVISAIVDALMAGFDLIKNAGGYLLEGLWAGIKDKVEWLKGKVSGVVDTIKSWFTGKEGFDEHSPSKWAKQVFRYVMEGGGEGLEEGFPQLMGNVSSVVEKVKQGMNFETATVDFASSGMGRSSSAIINSVSGGEDKVPVIPLTINLLTGNAEAFATWLLPDLIRVAKGNGTPITDGLRYA